MAASDINLSTYSLNFGSGKERVWTGVALSSAQEVNISSMPNESSDLHMISIRSSVDYIFR
jgi:hypothetical protein